jgi:hypothetical protein
LWFNKEAFEIAANWLFTIGALQIILRAETSINKNKKTRKAAADSKLSKAAAEKVGRQIVELYEIVEQWRKAEAASEYKVAKLLEELKSAPSRVNKIQKTKKKS